MRRFLSVPARAKRSGLIVATGPLVLGLMNIFVLVVLTLYSEHRMGAAAVAAVGFWGLLAVYPWALDRNLVLGPRNWVVMMLFMSMVVGPALMPFDEELRNRLFFLTYARYDTRTLFDYMLPAALLWVAGMAAYLLGLRHQVWSPARDKGVREPEKPALWMFVGGGLLVALGVGGLVLAAGSLSAAIQIAGVRAAAADVLSTSEARYTAFWMDGVPLGAALLWYWGTRRFGLGRVGSAVLVVALFVPLFPLYLYTGGRAPAIIPLLILLALYHRFVFRFSGWWVVGGIFVLLPVMRLWAQYRLTGGLSGSDLSGTLSVVTGDFSRFDISVAALAGIHGAKMAPYWGETLISAVTLWLPSGLRPDVPDGTLALFRALIGDESVVIQSPYASALVIEGYLNFRLPGTLLFMYGLGRGVGVLSRMARSPSFLLCLIAAALAIRLPIAVSLDQSLLLIVRSLLGPLLILKVLQALLSFSVRAPSARTARARRTDRVPA